MLTAKGPGSARAAHRTRAPVETVLERLEARGCTTQKSSSHKWRSQCPGNHSKANKGGAKPLSITERSDGKASIRCYAGCEYEEVLAELGLEPQDLYPDRLEFTEVPKIPWPSRAELGDIAHEAMVVLVASTSTEPLTQQDRHRLSRAVSILHTAMRKDSLHPISLPMSTVVLEAQQLSTTPVFRADPSGLRGAVNRLQDVAEQGWGIVANG